MYCNKCGATLASGSAFCIGCGAPVLGASMTAPTAAPMVAPRRRSIVPHLPFLGVIWILGGLAPLSGGLVLVGIFHHGFGSPYWGTRPWGDNLPPFIIPMLSLVGVVLIAAGVLALAAGIGLLLRAPWARVLAIVIAIVALISIPFGTAAGIYTLWVLLPRESEAEYETLSGA